MNAEIWLYKSAARAARIPRLECTTFGLLLKHWVVTGHGAFEDECLLGFCAFHSTAKNALDRFW
jgi:hypothetical protein